MRILVSDTIATPFQAQELARLQEFDVDITVNIHKLKKTDTFSHFKKFKHIDFDIENPDALIHELTKDRLGYHVLQLATNVCLDQKFIQLAVNNLKFPLKIITQIGVGIDHIDTKSASENDILVINTPGSNAVSVAELIMGQMLDLARGISYNDFQGHQGLWTYNIPSRPYIELNNKTLGIIGLGQTASALIPRAQAFGMKILGYSRTKKDLENIEQVSILKDLLSHSDFVSLNVPLTKYTQNLIGKDELKIMKKGAYLINVSRGGVVDEKALAEELLNPNRNIAGAACDVFLHEKKSFNTPLTECSNVLITSHLGGRTLEALENALTILSDNLIKILNYDYDIVCVNPEVLQSPSWLDKSLFT